MNLLQLAWSYLRASPLGTLLNVLLLALGVGTIGFVVIVNDQIAGSLNRDAQGVDLVVGAKGSPIQLILTCIFHLDAPTGNVPLKSAQELAKDPLIRRVIPQALGDNFRGFWIVGTTPDYIDLYHGAYASGRGWNTRMEAVLGATVAQQTGLGVGGRFVGSHGLAEGGALHADNVYTVTGVLKPTGTVLDRLVLVNTESVWFVHEGKITDPEEMKVIEDERQMTVLLVQYATPLAAASLPRKINSETNMQAASPAMESARLFRMVGVGADVIRAFGGVVLATAALSLFIALYHALNERAYDIAVLRTLGARRSSIALMLVLEALTLAVLGGLLGLLLAHGLAAILASWMQEQRSLHIDPWAFSAEELWLLLPALLAAAAAAVLPSWRAAHADISSTLARRA
jgi:putative ABC transport system permease protein